MHMPRPGEDLPEVDTNNMVSAELSRFRHQWSPAKPAMGDAKWETAVELANRIDKGIDFVRKMAGPGFEVDEAMAAARSEIQLALDNSNIPRKHKDDLQLYVEMYSIEEVDV